MVFARVSHTACNTEEHRVAPEGFVPAEASKMRSSAWSRTAHVLSNTTSACSAVWATEYFGRNDQT